MIITPFFSFVGVGTAGVGGNGGSGFLMNASSPGNMFNTAENIASFDRIVVFAFLCWLLQQIIPPVVKAMRNHELAEAGRERIADANPLKEENNKRWNAKARGDDLSLLAKLEYERTGKMGAWDPQRDRMREVENERLAESVAASEEYKKKKKKNRYRNKKNQQGRS